LSIFSENVTLKSGVLFSENVTPSMKRSADKR